MKLKKREEESGHATHILRLFVGILIFTIMLFCGFANTPSYFVVWMLVLIWLTMD